MRTTNEQTPPADEGPVERRVRPLPKAGPVCFADAQSILEYKVPAVGRHLPGVLDVGLWTTDQMRAYADASAAEERTMWETALRQTWQMIDPLRPSGVPGSYARGEHEGIAAALGTLRRNLRPNVGNERAARADDDRSADAGGGPLD